MFLTVPGHHLLRSSNALGRVVLAPDGCLGLAQSLGGRAAGDLAAVVLHVHVGLAAFGGVSISYSRCRHGITGSTYSHQGSRAKHSSNLPRGTQAYQQGHRAKSHGRRES